MLGDQHHAQSTKDQRRQTRDSVETQVTLRLETDAVEGVSDNLSEAGIMFFTDEPLRCTVEVKTEDGSRSFGGRIVRVQRMSEENTGLAVEFDAN